MAELPGSVLFLVCIFQFFLDLSSFYAIFEFQTYLAIHHIFF